MVELTTQTKTCRLIESCASHDLLEYAHETVRLLSYEGDQQTVTFTFEPCQCSTCTVGYTRHGHNRKATAPLHHVHFPKYAYLRMWDQWSPVTRLFRCRSGKRSDVEVFRDLVYGPRGPYHQLIIISNPRLERFPRLVWNTSYMSTLPKQMASRPEKRKTCRRPVHPNGNREKDQIMLPRPRQGDREATVCSDEPN